MVFTKSLVVMDVLSQSYGNYPLVNVYIFLTMFFFPCLMGKSTISMVFSNSYVELPGGCIEAYYCNLLDVHPYQQVQVIGASHK